MPIVQTPVAVAVRVSDDALAVELSDGRVLSVPVAWYPRLSHGTPEERNRWQLIGQGHGIHWPDLDEDISVEGLLAGRASGESQKSFKKWLDGRVKAVAVHVVYRRRKGASTWHFCRNCSTWPTSDFDEQTSKPTAGELCYECQTKYHTGMCHSP
jgi:hypothetical protein